ncbi:MAG TPA: rRNA maturation RNase YbeY, partial [Actinomycetota bacterium]
MDVFLANEQELAVDEARLAALARYVLSVEKVDGSAELSVLFVSSDHIRQLNARFAGEDHATDVLAFPMMEEEDGALLLGDVVVCPAVAEKNATQLGHDLDAELEALVVHGTLHLLGYDHQGTEDKAKMDQRMGE